MPTHRDAPEPEEWIDEDEESETATPDVPLAATEPEADALEQAQEAAPGERQRHIDLEPDVPEADAIDQATEVPFDPDEDRHTT